MCTMRTMHQGRRAALARHWQSLYLRMLCSRSLPGTQHLASLKLISVTSDNSASLCLSFLLHALSSFLPACAACAPVAAVCRVLLQVGLFSLGIIPYINASIVLQLMSAAFPALKKMQREDGPQGRARFQYYQKLAAFVFAIAQVTKRAGLTHKDLTPPSQQQCNMSCRSTFCFRLYNACDCTVL